ncbi:conserved hypothetical protein [Thioalkalivibrio sp. K90mix]|uniref:PEP-CTERM/exosortase system-associated acyltransferase n=1 Tax=Thioalkalivibrio sp. (strain K90mix) TaxID=396595 RepID=UPI000195A09D|nr:PEP-CTERM/exosortase system-associated acyltransferase [Thioalkalivibrio sp. K90mix]ADC72993.1 conserved hypothetical protein [Thioalkalivibrio sp. K90mix]
MQDDPLITAFCRYFSLVKPDKEQLEAVYRLRYEVYCREFRYESPENCPGEREIDEYDAQASHCLLEHVVSGTHAGCVRVVHVDARQKIHELPMERHCDNCFYETEYRPDRLERDAICEVSRLAVNGLFRRRLGESVTPVGDLHLLNVPLEQARTFPLLALSLFMSAVAMMEIQGRSHAFAMMEPSLARILRRHGLKVKQIGTLQNYHGRRAPFHISLLTALSGIHRSPSLSQLYAHSYANLSDPHPSDSLWDAIASAA